MKRTLCFTLILSLLLGASGCSLLPENSENTVVFYYEQTEYQYGQADAVVCGEKRDSSGHNHDLQYLLSLYMMGPVSSTLKSPFPEGMQVLDVKVRMDLVRVTVSEELNTLSDSRHSLALACLALTSMELSGQESVVIVCGEDHTVLDRTMLTLFDSAAKITPKEGETP